jgi:prevent-host-death family protein
MTRLNVSKAREEFPDVVNRAAFGKQRTIVCRRGKDVAAVVPMEDLDLLERLTREEMDRCDIEDARAAIAEANQTGTVSLSNAKKILGLQWASRSAVGKGRRRPADRAKA